MISTIKGFKQFLKDIYHSRDLMKSLAINDIKMRYSGSVLGIFWALIQPLMTILILWFVYQVGFRTVPVSNVPFILWLLPGYIPWLYFSDAVSTSTASLYEYSYLIKKVRFRTSILPLVKVLSSTFVHLFFMIFLLVLFTLYNRTFYFIYLQIFYYSFCTIVLLTGLSWLVSSISVFIKDFTQIVNIALQIGFWAAPIIWDPQGMSSFSVSILKLNPMFYIIQGYRNSLINHIPFYANYNLTMYFWCITAIIFAAGAITYKLLRPHFADLL